MNICVIKKVCIVCNSDVDTFNPGVFPSELFEKHHIIGGGYRENCICPNCNSMDRERWLFYILKNKTDIMNLNGKVLHFVPEPSVEKLLKTNNNIDYYSGDIEIGRTMYVTDITNIQYADKTFDYIICNHVFEHIPNIKKAIKEIKRVLKNDGKLVFSFPICLDEKTFEDKNITSTEDRIKYYGQEDHVRLYGNDFKKIWFFKR